MRKLIYPILFVAITVVGFFWYLQPTYANIQDLLSQVDEYEQTLSQVNQLQEELNRKLEQRDAVTNAQLDRLNRLLPPTVDTVRFLIELDQIAAQHGMSVQNVSFSGAPAAFGGSDSQGGSEERNYNILKTSFSVSGSYTEVQDFMRDIERSSRLMDITNFSLSAPEADDQASLASGNNQYSFSLETYWRNQNGS